MLASDLSLRQWSDGAVFSLLLTRSPGRQPGLLQELSCWHLKEILKNTQFDVVRFHFIQNIEGLNVNKDTESLVTKPKQV